MKKVDEKYGIDGNQKEVKDFHCKRRMFAIVDNQLFIAPEKSTLSHAEWFIEKGFIRDQNDKVFDEIVRGFVENNEIYFYVGYDFSINEKAEKIFFKHLENLKFILKLSDTSKVYGGMIKQEKPGKWPGKIYYGTILLLTSRV
ncbi:MAG: hypothetical protein ABIA04_09590 [Pseudomonadota bacterium]